MKAIRFYLITLMAGVALVSANAASTNEPSLRYNLPLSKQEAVRLGAAITRSSRVYKGAPFGRNMRLSGSLARIAHAPRQALQLFNPFAPADQTVPRAATGTVPVSDFGNLQVHEPDMVLVRVSWP